MDPLYSLAILFVVVIVLFCLILLTERKPKAIDITPSALKATVKTIGKMSYIPLNWSGEPYENIEMIYQAIDVWQKANPDKEIVQIDFLGTQHAYATTSATHGISILFR